MLGKAAGHPRSARRRLVIQLDSDTVTLEAIPEVLAAIEDNRSFTLSGDERESEVGVQDIPQFDATFCVGPPRLDHVQLLAEHALINMPGNEQLRYFRGCAGFAGFSRQPNGRVLVERFSEAMHRLIGQRWEDWGSEQVASNFVIANEDDVIHLGYDRYINHWLQPIVPQYSFIHFIGTHRYARGAYAKATRAAISALKQD